MWNEPTPAQLAKVPMLYETENTPLKNKIIHMHFFLGRCDWYIAEYNGNGIFFGYAILNNDLEMGEWGYISYQELKQLSIPPGIEVDRDIHWKPVEAWEVDKILTN